MSIQVDYYQCACEYMAKTELYDRSLTTKRDEHDPTCASLQSIELRKLSIRYAFRFQLEYISLGIWKEIKACIRSHKNYTAQMWVDEWHRIQKERSEEGDG